MNKSTVSQIRDRFDHDVERFSNLATGQSATMDAPLSMDLIVEAASRVTPGAKAVLDIGCGAGNYTLKFLERMPDRNSTLVDLSRPMLDRAQERVSQVTSGTVTTHQADVRDLSLEPGSHDVAMAAAVLHHLREDSEWEAVFAKVFQWLRPGGSFWISDLVEHGLPVVQSMMWRRYGEYLTSLKDEAYRDHVFAYVEQEDTPRPLMYQVDVLRAVGFQQVEVLHKNGCFAAFGGVKP